VGQNYQMCGLLAELYHILN